VGDQQGPNRRREWPIREGLAVQIKLLEAEEHQDQEQGRRSGVKQARTVGLRGFRRLELIEWQRLVGVHIVIDLISI
jgi:hypothetical protein